MRRLFTISTALLLIIATLVGSAGLSVHKMACLDSGRISFSLEQDLCCAGANSIPSDQAILPICCAFDQLAFSVSEFDFQKVVAKVLLPATSTTHFIINEERDRVATIKPKYFVPPLSGTERLSIYCTYLI